MIPRFLHRWHAAMDDDPVSVPREALSDLLYVARWVAAERARHGALAPDVTLPDATASRALGALDDAGLLDQFREDGSDAR